MMYSYPFFRFPRMGGFGSYGGYYPYSHFANTKAMPKVQENINSSLYKDKSASSLERLKSPLQQENRFPLYNKNSQIEKNYSSSTSKFNANVESRKKDNRQDEEILFEIFGLKLYYDDILLICLIFFLYQEGVQDQYLFFALVLLLLS